MILLLVASAAVFVFVVVAYLRSGFASVYHPLTLYLTFHGFIFVLRPFFAYAFDYDRMYRAAQFVPSPETKSIVIVAANLGLLAFVAGAWKSGAVPLIFRQSRDDLDKRRRLIPQFLLIAAVAAPIAIASMLSVYQGAWSTMRLDTSTGITVNTSANGWFIDAQQMLVPLSVLFAWLFGFRLWSFAPLITFVVAGAGTGGRGPFVVACVAAGMLWLFDRKRQWPSARVAGLALVLAAGFWAVGQDRGVAVRTFFDSGEIVEVRKEWGFMESMDFANLEFFEYLVETIPAKTGTHGYFVSNLQILTEPIPRKLWPGKPVGAPIKLYNIFEHGKPFGFTYSLPGEGWAQAGFFGVIAWCGLWGLALGAIYARFARGPQGNFAVALYFAFLPIFVIAFRDGQLITVLRAGVFYLAPIAAWALVARLMEADGKRPRLAASPGAEPRRRRRSESAADEGIVPRAWRGRAAPGER